MWGTDVKVFYTVRLSAGNLLSCLSYTQVMYILSACLRGYAS